MLVPSTVYMTSLTSLIKVDGQIDTKVALDFMKQQAQMTVQESFKGQTLSLIKMSDERPLFQALNALLHATNLSLNVAHKLNEFQAFDIIQTLMNDYRHVKLEELIYIFKQGKKGIYGPHYNKFDIETICHWINSYFISDEYNNYLENRHKKPLQEVELSQEQKDKWKEVISNFKNFVKENKTSEGPVIVNKVSKNVFKERFKNYAKELSISDLKSLLKEYKDTAPDYAEVINEELNSRKK